MASADLITKCKLSQRITTAAFDSEIGALLDAAMLDMGVAGVEVPASLDALVETAAFTYVKCHFGQPGELKEYDRLKKSYDEQKAQLSMCTGYTDWGDTDG